MAAAAPQLGRAAKGLPRYWMDVGWYRARRFLGLPVEALFTFEAIVGYCNQHATDGRVPADVEDLAAALGLRVSIVRKGVRALLEQRYDDVEAPLARHGAELVVRGWADHNPTAAEVEQHSGARSKSGRRGNHVRWHVERGVVDPGCPYCDEGTPAEEQPPTPDDPPDSQTDRTSDRTGDPETVANPSHGMGWDGIATQPSSDTSPAASRKPDDDHEQHQQPPDQGDPPPSGAEDQVVDLMGALEASFADAKAARIRRQRAGAALGVLAQRDLDANPNRVGDPEAWLTTAYDRRRASHGAQLEQLVAEHPDATAAQLADLADPARPAGAKATSSDPYAAQRNALYAQAERNTAERAGRPPRHEPVPGIVDAVRASLPPNVPGAR